jgi:hypothetical protein
MVLLGFASIEIGIMVAVFTVVVSLLVLEVIDDLDDPFTGALGVSSAPFERIRFSQGPRADQRY